MRNSETFTHTDTAAMWRVVAKLRKARGDLAGAAIAARNALAQRAAHEVGMYHQNCPGSGRQWCC